MSLSQSTIFIKQPRETVWAALTEPENMKKWMTSFTGHEQITGQGLESGTVHHWMFHERGRDIVMKQRVKDVHEPEVYSFRLDHDFITSDCQVTLTAKDGGTEVEWKEKCYGKTFIWKLLVPLMQGSFCKRLDRNFIRLKSLLETAA